MTETALAVVDNTENLPDNYDNDYTGYEDIGSDAFIIPRVKIIQPTAKEGNPGNFRINLTGEEFETLNVVAIKAQRSRVKWDDDDTNTDPVCRSYNFFTPDPEIEEPVSPACVEKVQRGNKIILNQVCPDCKWVNRQRPPCDEMFNLLCLDVNEMLPFWINVGGASIKAVKQFISAIGVRRKKLWEFQVEFSLDVRTEPHKHYVLRISPPRKLENGDLSDICDMVMELKEETIERSIKAEEAAAENADSDSEGGSTEATAPAWMDEPEEMKHEQTEVFDADTKKRSSSKKGKK